MMLVLLNGEDGSLHASGMIEKSKLSEAHLLMHNGKYYYFKKITPEFYLQFEECNQPYVITEF